MRKRLRKKLIDQVIHGELTKVHLRHPDLSVKYRHKRYGYTISDGGVCTGISRDWDYVGNSYDEFKESHKWKTL